LTNIRIVLADDHAVLRDGVTSLLASQPDMEVVGEADNGTDLVAECQRSHPDVALVDLSMPDGGVQAIARLRQEATKTRILVLTMHDDQEYVRSALGGGASGYVTKRSAGKELIHAIREVSAGRSYIRVSLSEEGLVDLVSEQPSGRSRTDLDAVLSRREVQVLRLLAFGYTNKEVAVELDLSTKSIDTYRARLQAKLGLKGRVSLVRCALDAGLLEDELPEGDDDPRRRPSQGRNPTPVGYPPDTICLIVALLFMARHSRRDGARRRRSQGHGARGGQLPLLPQGAADEPHRRGLRRRRGGQWRPSARRRP